MNRRAFLGTAALAAGSLAFGAEASPRHELLSFRNSEGDWQPVKTPADWQQRRLAILAAMQEIMGPMPGAEKRCPLDVQTIEEVDCGAYLRRTVTYASEPGSRVPAYLLTPKSLLKAKTPSTSAILCLHPTDNVNGCKVVVGLGGKANRQYAAELAHHGYVTLAPAYPLLADYQPDLTALGYVSGTMKAIWDNMRGLDLLATLPFVKPGGFGAIGHSLGGHNSVYTATFDERIKAVVSSCGLDSFADYKGGDITGWTSNRYMPRLADYKGRAAETPFDFDEVLAALAPRHVLISAPLKDDNFKAASVDRITTTARQVFALHGVPERLEVVHPDCPHDFPDEVREKAYAFLDKALRS